MPVEIVTNVLRYVFASEGLKITTVLTALPREEQFCENTSVTTKTTVKYSSNSKKNQHTARLQDGSVWGYRTSNGAKPSSG